MKKVLVIMLIVGFLSLVAFADRYTDNDTASAVLGLHISKAVAVSFDDVYSLDGTTKDYTNNYWDWTQPDVNAVDTLGYLYIDASAMTNCNFRLKGSFSGINGNKIVAGPTVTGEDHNVYVKAELDFFPNVAGGWVVAGGQTSANETVTAPIAPNYWTHQTMVDDHGTGKGTGTLRFSLYAGDQFEWFDVANGTNYSVTYTGTIELVE